MLTDLKMLLGIPEDDTSQDTKLSLLLDMANARLKNLLGGIDTPDTLKHVVIEAAVKRYNRIGSEGFSSHTVEGESIAMSEDDFTEYSGEIQRTLETMGCSEAVRFF